jgi:hypothetical protein
LKKLITYLIFLLSLFSCEEEEYSPIPDIPFSINVYLDRPPFNTFGIGEAMALTEDVGYAGIILYRASPNNFNAFDLCCPYHFEEKEQLSLDGALAICPTDSVMFPLMSATIAIELNSAEPMMLRVYKTRLSGDILTIYNN